MIGDVPLGSFVSGGIDSPLVTAPTQEQTDQLLHTFTIGSPSSVLDESLRGRQIAKTLATSHAQFEATKSQAFEMQPVLGEVYSEPSADSSRIPSNILSHFPRAEAKVALTRDGGMRLSEVTADPERGSKHGNGAINSSYSLGKGFES